MTVSVLSVLACPSFFAHCQHPQQRCWLAVPCGAESSHAVQVGSPLLLVQKGEKVVGRKPDDEKQLRGGWVWRLFFSFVVEGAWQVIGILAGGCPGQAALSWLPGSAVP